MLKKGLSKYDPGIVNKMENISTKVADKFKEVAKKHRNRS